MSSAYRDGVEYFKESGISFMYNRNNKGPKIDPCGTPHFIFLGLDK